MDGVLICDMSPLFSDVSCGHVPPTPVSSRPQLDSIEMMRESVFVGGRYLKYTRDVSQTPWSIGTTMLAELSVSGIVCETLKNAFRADGMSRTLWATISQYSESYQEMAMN